MFYLAIFILLIFFSFLELTAIDGVYKRILLIVAFFILWLVSGLRFETGGDWTTYTEFFHDVEPLDKVLAHNAPVYEESYMEPAYKLLNSTVKSLGGNIQAIFLIVALLNSILLFQGLKKYSVYPLTGVMIYFASLYFLLDMLATRQAIAVLLFLSSIGFIYQRQFWRFFITMCIAFVFHRSCILLFPFYFIINRTFSNKGHIFIFIFSLAIFGLQVHWMGKMLSVVAKIIGGTNGDIINMYLKSTTYGANRLLSVGVLINVVLFVLFMVKREELSKFRYFNIFFNLFMANVIVFFVFYEFIEISNRYRSYFLISNLVLLPYLIFLYKESAMRMAVFACICGFSFLYGRSVFLEDPAAIAFNPYQNYLIHEIFDTKSDGAERLKESDRQYIDSRKR